jgi:alanyl-tRNA synthetase
VKALTAKQLIDTYLNFFKERGHAIIPSAPLVPEGDASTLFISAGMQPLVPYLLGEPHQQGKRLVDVQKCLRTEDIEGVGEIYNRHTFFQMLGNWSLGDYFKKESIVWSFEFLTNELGIDPAKLHITIFKGNKNSPYDKEAEQAWLAVGIPKERIYSQGKDENWWEAGETGPGGPDTEIFFDTGKKPCGPKCGPSCKCGKYYEIWNNVFIEFNRKEDGTYESLKQKNVDTGMGVENTTAVLQGFDDNYQIEIWVPVIAEIERLSGKIYAESSEVTRNMRIVADHIRAATFVLAEGVCPSKTDQGYVLRRLIRRSIRHGKKLGIEDNFTGKVAAKVTEIYGDSYPELSRASQETLNTLTDEETTFRETLSKGLRQFEKISCDICGNTISGKQAFDLYQSYGFPIEMTEELAVEKGFKVDKDEFQKEFATHQERSRTAAKGHFKGGLAEMSEETKKLHTATHLLNQALREVLKDKNIVQKGSNITPERLRFDFNFDRKLTGDEVGAVEGFINNKVEANLPVCFKDLSLEDAKKCSAQAQFGQKYADTVKVYFIGDPTHPCSVEVCGGPHVSSTGELGRFRIVKQEAVGKGVRRIKAVLQ